MTLFLSRWCLFIVMIKRLIKRWKNILNSTFACLGFLITVKEILNFFSLCDDTIKRIEDSWMKWFIIFLFICLWWGIIVNFPKKSFNTKIKDRDSTINLKIWNAFKNKWALVMPINDNLDVYLNWNTKWANSIQNQVIRRYYWNQKDDFKLEIQKELKWHNLPLPIGSVLKIDNRRKTLYLLVNSKKTEDNHVSSSEKDLTLALNGFWSFLAKNEVRWENIIIPLINTQHWRNAKITKNNSAKQIIKTFIYKSRTEKICENLTISIYSKDLDFIDFDDLCSYAKFLANNYTDEAFD